jgi:glycosyltransferase involved in cell wall biosynthesis
VVTGLPERGIETSLVAAGIFLAIISAGAGLSQQLPPEVKSGKMTMGQYCSRYAGDSLYACQRYYASLDICVHTGKHETFCQSIQEALASGVPVIAPNSGGPTDLVKHGWTGFLIDTSNTYSLNHSVNQILHSSEHRLMSERARESVIHRTWELVNSQLVMHYKDLVLSQAQQNERVA